MSADDLRAQLRRLDEGAAALQSATIAALNGQAAGDWRVSARIAPREGGLHGWIRFQAGDGALSLAPVIVAGKVARTIGAEGSADALAAAASLVDLEPLVALVEEAFALPLHPAGLDPQPPLGSALIELTASGRDGVAVARALLAIPPDLAQQPVPPRPVPLPPGLRLPWRAMIAGPSLTGTEAAALEKGGLLLLGTIVSAARLFLPGRRGATRASVDLSQRSIRIDELADEGGSMLDEEVADHPAADSAAAPGTRVDAVLATTIELPGGTVRASELASLGEGSVLSLNATGGTLNVRVSVDGNAVAEGELVALGQGYAVLVTALLAPEQP